MLPQLVCVLFVRTSNGYGAAAGYVVAFVMRVLCGEPLFGLPAVLRFPGCAWVDGVHVQRWPFKTICMLSSLGSVVVSSWASSQLFKKGILPERWDVLGVKAREALAPERRSPTPADGARGGDGENQRLASEPMLESKC
ncbi:unnamed protein product [Menidia menidia]|uniref:(Atlantic silverside) hypothetical protein n=1 Tax=Menidia menidia TaxID=238744 RepID=A0A8S4B6C8_9TELE|nr:unnamed protein product [Menidia menidia]